MRRGGGERGRSEGRSAVETWNISYDGGMCGCITRAMCAVAASYATVDNALNEFMYVNGIDGVKACV